MTVNHDFLSGSVPTLYSKVSTTIRFQQPTIILILVIVVIGNEAMDLDSMVSSLVCAYFLSVTSNGQEFVIPVLNLPRGEMRLRKDNLLALERSGKATFKPF